MNLLFLWDLFLLLKFVIFICSSLLFIYLFDMPDVLMWLIITVFQFKASSDTNVSPCLWILRFGYQSWSNFAVDLLNYENWLMFDQSPRKLAKISKNTTSRADNSKKRMVTPNFFSLKMYLVSCFCVMQSLKKFSPLVLTPGYVLKI